MEGAWQFHLDMGVMTATNAAEVIEFVHHEVKLVYQSWRCPNVAPVFLRAH